MLEKFMMVSIALNLLVILIVLFLLVLAAIQWLIRYIREMKRIKYSQKIDRWILDNLEKNEQKRNQEISWETLKELYRNGDER